MINFDHNQLEQLLAEGKLSEAKALLEAYFSAQATPEEEGEAYVNLAAIYLKIQNDLDEKYLEVLDEAVEQLTNLSDGRKRISEKVRVAHLKSELS